jgi:hypothetical protein
VQATDAEGCIFKDSLPRSVATLRRRYHVSAVGVDRDVRPEYPGHGELGGHMEAKLLRRTLRSFRLMFVIPVILPVKWQY